MAIKILSVDDEQDLEALLTQYFRRKIRKGEYEFSFAHNGLEALRMMLDHPDFDIILSDINMPEMDGLTLLTKINEMRNPALKCIIVSAYGDMENIRTAMNHGAFDFATKPIDMEDLERTIEKAVEQISFIKEALRMMLDHPDFDIILSDINMPEMDGLTLLTKINEMRNPALKCIIVSAYGDMENIRTAMNHGAFDFATKPIDMEDLERTIEKAVEQISFIKEAQKEHHQLEEIQYDLNVAREIQQSILPKQFPPFPQYKQFDLYATMSAAKAVGGDFYDFFLVDDNHLGFTIADVSDKGIPAAIFMAISRTVIRATALRQLSPAVCMKESNDLLCRESVNGMFVTTFYAILNIHTGDVVYCNGGHNRPVWIRKNDKVSLLPMTGGMALGVVPGLAYKEQSLKLEAGDSLFLYTDGISEAMNLRNEQYGDIRLVEACSSVKNQSPKSMIEGISESVQSFVNGATQSDDITMLALTYKG